MTLKEIKELESKLISEMPKHFALNNEQFRRELERLGITEEDVVHLGNGFFCKKEEYHRVKELNDEIKAMYAEWRSIGKNLREELIHEFYNHDCKWTEEPMDAIAGMHIELTDTNKHHINMAWKTFCFRNHLFYAAIYPEVESAEPLYKEPMLNALSKAVKESEFNLYGVDVMEQFAKEYGGKLTASEKDDGDKVVRSFMEFAENIGQPCRRCSECGKLMRDGYFYNHGEAYYCSDECLNAHFTDEEWQQECEENDQSYYTELY